MYPLWHVITISIWVNYVPKVGHVQDGGAMMVSGDGFWEAMAVRGGGIDGARETAGNSEVILSPWNNTGFFRTLMVGS